ncbi:LytTR family transcriptional regulator [Anaerocolumna cellulosilytica]|uniref:LytTR family transcriptional regulator n=1 Tax=Anaerocolumna cellulosilytica TaxID=433286 RepID=A0A6S6QT13_9FIRM|nr:LytTR family DNA-binding domain-containing protein [Anaerocolumna cellulosilytica]MBB5195958.1 DNA-binding LytR/AlgR family response regulator [Anaerocolumna cellulosilytica]BCJ93744.1 LytTR family transcriptional regulator [Anaerocolumna cellulosilytica]
MIVKLEQDLSRNEIEILIKYATMNKDVKRITAMLQSINTRIKCRLDNSDKLVNTSDIYYFESVDKRTFVYCEQSVYRTESRIYQLAEDLAHLGFVQINKACVLNLNVLDYIKPLLNSRMEATLKNGERLYITRKYLDNIKQALQEGSNL